MRYIIAAAAALLLLCAPAGAQAPTRLCIPSINSQGQTSCQDVTSANPFPVAGAYNYTHITTDATTVIKTGAGLLHSVCINTPVASETVTIDDATSATTPTIAVLTIPATITSAMPQCVIYDVVFSTGLTVVTATAAGDITVSWR
jgi:hypothetical protein